MDDAPHSILVTIVRLHHLLRDRVEDPHRAVHRRRDHVPYPLIDGQRADRVARAPRPLRCHHAVGSPHPHRGVLGPGDPQVVDFVPLDVANIGRVTREHPAAPLALAPLGHRRAALQFQPIERAPLRRLGIGRHVPELDALIGRRGRDLLQLGREGDREDVVVVRVLDVVRRARLFPAVTQLVQIPQPQREIPRDRDQRRPDAAQTSHAVGVLLHHVIQRGVRRTAQARLARLTLAAPLLLGRIPLLDGPGADRPVVAPRDEGVERLAVQGTEHRARVAWQGLVVRVEVRVHPRGGLPPPHH